MSTFPIQNTAEGGSDTTTVTTGNSGGASGSAFDLVTIAGNGALTFDNDHPAAGTLGYKILRPTNTNFAPEFRWDFADFSEMWGRMYVYLPSGTFPSVVRLTLFQSSGGARRAELNLNSTRNLRVINQANATSATSSAALSADTMYRIEWHFLGQATTGRMETKIFLGDSTTPSEQLLIGSDIDTGGVAGRWAFAASSGTLTDGYAFWMDELAGNQTTWVGPATVADNTMKGATAGMFGSELSGNMWF